MATFQEHNIEYQLPHPIFKVVFTYATLTYPLHVVPLVQFHSITVYDVKGEVITYIQQLTAFAYQQRLSRRSIPPAQTSDPSRLPPRYTTLAPQNPSTMSAGRGYNTFHGFDTGPPPPGFALNQPAGAHPYSNFGWPQQPQAFGWPAQPTFPPPVVMAPPPVMPSYPYPFPYPHPGMAHPAMPPVGDGGIPRIQ